MKLSVIFEDLKQYSKLSANLKEPLQSFEKNVFSLSPDKFKGFFLNLYLKDRNNQSLKKVLDIVTLLTTKGSMFSPKYLGDHLMNFNDLNELYVAIKQAESLFKFNKYINGFSSTQKNVLRNLDVDTKRYLLNYLEEIKEENNLKALYSRSSFYKTEEELIGLIVSISNMTTNYDDILNDVSKHNIIYKDKKRGIIIAWANEVKDIKKLSCEMPWCISDETEINNHSDGGVNNFVVIYNTFTPSDDPNKISGVFYDETGIIESYNAYNKENTNYIKDFVSKFGLEEVMLKHYEPNDFEVFDDNYYENKILDQRSFHFKDLLFLLTYIYVDLEDDIELKTKKFLEKEDIKIKSQKYGFVDFEKLAQENDYYDEQGIYQELANQIKYHHGLYKDFLQPNGRTNFIAFFELYVETNNEKNTKKLANFIYDICLTIQYENKINDYKFHPNSLLKILNLIFNTSITKEGFDAFYKKWSTPNKDIRSKEIIEPSMFNERDLKVLISFYKEKLKEKETNYSKFEQAYEILGNNIGLPNLYFTSDSEKREIAQDFKKLLNINVFYEVKNHKHKIIISENIFSF